MLLTFRLVGEIGFVKNILFCLEFNLIVSVVDIVERGEIIAQFKAGSLGGAFGEVFNWLTKALVTLILFFSFFFLGNKIHLKKKRKYRGKKTKAVC